MEDEDKIQIKKSWNSFAISKSTNADSLLVLSNLKINYESKRYEIRDIRYGLKIR